MRALQRDNRRIIFRKILFFIISALVIAQDRISKDLAVRYLEPKGSFPLIKGVFELTYCTNKGAAFSILSGKRWIFISVTALALAAMVFFVLTMNRAKTMFFVSLGMIAGGGAGNMIDRVFSGSVVDFFDFTLINFAIFNVADIFICVGTALLFADIIFIEKENSFKIEFKLNNGEAEDERRD